MTSDSFRETVSAIGPPLLQSLASLERSERNLHPPRIAAEHAPRIQCEQALRAARDALGETPAPDGLEDFTRELLAASASALEALALRTGSRGDIAGVLRSMHLHRRAEAALYPLRRVLPPISRFFLEPGAAALVDRLDPDPPSPDSGLHQAANAPGERGGFSLYVPESFHANEPLPLIVALHGGGGHGADFLWSWLREARSRRCLLLAPTSRGSTWSLMGPDVDTPQLGRMLDFVAGRWPVDTERILLTGLSDGATFSLLSGLGEQSPFRAIAPLSGVLHPQNAHNGNLDRAAGRRIYLVHGTLDWMFPIQTARDAARALREAGAALHYEEVTDLSHTYAREQNARILDWFGCPLPSS